MTDLTRIRPQHLGADHAVLAAAVLTGVLILAASFTGHAGAYATVDVAAVLTVVLAWFTSVDAIDRPWARPAAAAVAVVALIATLFSDAHALIALVGIAAGLATSPSRLVRAAAAVAMFGVAGVAAM